jgi:hypothetical protein
MQVKISPTPHILNSRKEARYYVEANGEVFPVSILVAKNHKLIDSKVQWAPLEAKIVKLDYSFIEDFLPKVGYVDVQTEEGLEKLFQDYSQHIYDMIVKEIYRLNFEGVDVYLLRNRRVKASSLKERFLQMEELKKELEDDYFDDKEIPALHIISRYGVYKVPFDTTRDNNEPLNKFVLIEEETAKNIVEEALENNINWAEYPPPRRNFIFDEEPPLPPTEYNVLYLSPHFIDLIYKKQ